MSKLKALYTLYFYMYGKEADHSNIVCLYYVLTKGKKDYRLPGYIYY